LEELQEDQGYTEETQNVTERYYERFGKSGEDGDLEEVQKDLKRLMRNI
jgi:hypothetical protein